MPITDCLPVAAWTFAEFGTFVGADMASALASDDGDTTYAARLAADGAGVLRCSFAMDPLPAQAARIISVELHHVARETVGEATTEAIAFLYRAATTAAAATRDITTSYVDYSDAYAQAPGAVAWTPAVWAATEAGIQAGQPTGEVRWTALYARVEWAPHVAAQLLELVLPLVGGLLGAGLRLGEMPALARAVLRRSPHRLLPREFEGLWLALRADPRRVYVG